FESDEAGADLFQLVRGAAHLGVGAIGFEVVGEDALPVCLLVGGNRGPVPVLHHIGAVGQIGVDILAKLAIVWRKLASRGPADGLSVGFCDQKVAVLERAGKVTLNGLE